MSNIDQNDERWINNDSNMSTKRCKEYVISKETISYWK